MPAIRPTTVPDDELWSFERRVANILVGLGFSEACNYSLMARSQLAPFTPGFGQEADAQGVLVANPLSQEQEMLRSSMLPALLQNALLNFRRQTPRVRFFEAGRIFYQDHAGRHEARRVGVLIAGDAHPPHWRRKKRKADFYDCSGAMEQLAAALHIPAVQLAPHRLKPFHPGRSCLLMSGPHVLGWLGEIHPELHQSLDTAEPLIAAELDLPALHQASRMIITYAPASSFPPVLRDLSVVAPRAVTYDKIEKTLRNAGGPALESIALIDLYEGDKIGPERKSLTMSLSFRLHERTLSDAEVEKLMGKILGDLEKKCQATLRT